MYGLIQFNPNLSNLTYIPTFGYVIQSYSIVVQKVQLAPNAVLYTYKKTEKAKMIYTHKSAGCMQLLFVFVLQSFCVCFLTLRRFSIVFHLQMENVTHETFAKKIILHIISYFCFHFHNQITTKKVCILMQISFSFQLISSHKELKYIQINERLRTFMCNCN